MTNRVKAKGKLPEWSDSLFTSVYQWIKQGTLPQKGAADASILRYPVEHRLNSLAICMRSLVMEGTVTPDWFIEQGYHSAKNQKKAEEKRQALVLSHISQEELTSVLTDIKRINRLWPIKGPKKTEIAVEKINFHDDLAPFFDKRHGGLYYIERKQNNTTGEIDEKETWFSDEMSTVGIGSDGKDSYLVIQMKQEGSNQIIYEAIPRRELGSPQGWGRL